MSSKMIGKLNVGNMSVRYDENGDAEITFKVSDTGKYALKEIMQKIKQGFGEGKKLLTLSIDWHKSKRSLDQNALLWALLTEYASALNSGRTGGILPEEVYYQVLSRYGKTEFLLAPEESKPMLEKAFRGVQIVDKRMVGSKELTMFKCVYGSSAYDTKEMTDLIEGVLDEMAAGGISTVQTRYLCEEYYGAKQHTA